MPLEAINPATGKTLKRYEEMNDAEVNAAIEAAHQSFLQWRETSFEHRASHMRKAAALLRERAREYGRLMAAEMGKPIRDGIAEAQKCATGCDYYAEYAERYLAEEPVDSGPRKSFVAFRPLGVVLAVMPWNFPFWQVIRFAAPALMAGNAGVLKHASNVPCSALTLEQLFRDAGFPEHLFRTLMIGSKMVGDVIAHPHVRAVSLTGSTPAGRDVAAKAGAALKKCVLELGGSDAYLVLSDADIEFTAASCAKGRLVNSGQSCIAAKRFIVIESLRSRFERQLVVEMGNAKVGDPMDEDTMVGPMARRDLRDELHEQVQKSVAKGARLLCGGEVPRGPGAFYPATVLSDVQPGQPAYDEEMFGPVAAVIAAKDVDDAVRIANDSEFGLGGGVFTRDLALGQRLATDGIDAGSVFVNATVSSDPKLPFGGVKDSGYGRELSSYGIREFVNIKTIVVAQHGGAPTSAHHSE
ncbi:MAG: NAD-dependent succinate-semialdehyde dehydrogenase [Alphaproteobacteria bacterium]|nr:NAD-dependent succinate-semialdehyde dehydrogenase [Alphaproteobacteria bacterium]MBV9062367.1 NAD-dependent succinate-semialdehyde dehydrogenase [Alphaproteobacteria bacterium]